MHALGSPAICQPLNNCADSSARTCRGHGWKFTSRGIPEQRRKPERADRREARQGPSKALRAMAASAATLLHLRHGRGLTAFREQAHLEHGWEFQRLTKPCDKP